MTSSLTKIFGARKKAQVFEMGKIFYKDNFHKANDYSGNENKNQDGIIEWIFNACELEL